MHPANFVDLGLPSIMSVVKENQWSKLVFNRDKSVLISAQQEENNFEFNGIYRSYCPMDAYGLK